jgi:hypothetical protein
MRRLVVLVGILTLVGTMAGPSIAANGARPKLEITNFHKSSHPGPEGEQEWILTVEARDIDGVIWEVEVEWGNRHFTWATTFCVQGPEVGKKAVLRLGNNYATAGTYRVRARAVSIPTCDAGFEHHQVGPWDSAYVQVVP